MQLSTALPCPAMAPAQLGPCTGPWPGPSPMERPVPRAGTAPVPPVPPSWWGTGTGRACGPCLAPLGTPHSIGLRELPDPTVRMNEKDFHVHHSLFTFFRLAIKHRNVIGFLNYRELHSLLSVSEEILPPSLRLGTASALSEGDLSAPAPESLSQALLPKPF